MYKGCCEKSSAPTQMDGLDICRCTTLVTVMSVGDKTRKVPQKFEWFQTHLTSIRRNHDFYLSIADRGHWDWSMV